MTDDSNDRRADSDPRDPHSPALLHLRAGLVFACEARHGRAGQGLARHGEARRGTAGQGEVSF